MTNTKYIIYSYRAGYQFIINDGDTLTAEQSGRYESFDDEADAIAEVTRKYKVQLDGGHICGGSDNMVHYDDAIIAQFNAEAAEEGAKEDYSFYTVPGYYEGGRLEISDEELSKGVGRFTSDVTTTLVVRVEIIEQEDDFDEEEEELAA